MTNRYRLVIFLCLAIGGLACKHSAVKLSFIKLEMASQVDTLMDRGTRIFTKLDSYIVDGYTDNHQAQNLIDSFVQKNKDPLLSKYSQYDIVFYKKSEKTNPQNLHDNPRDLDRYSQNDDRIYEYHWFRGKFLSKWKLKNGEIIEPKHDIKIEDIPDSTK